MLVPCHCSNHPFSTDPRDDTTERALTYPPATPYADTTYSGRKRGSTSHDARQEEVHLATWRTEDTIAQEASWGSATPPANKVGRIMPQPEIKEAVFRVAVLLQLSRVIADNAPDTKAKCNSQPSKRRTRNCSIESSYTHRRQGIPRTTKARTTAFSYTTNQFKRTTPPIALGGQYPHRVSRPLTQQSRCSPPPRFF